MHRSELQRQPRVLQRRLRDRPRDDPHPGAREPPFGPGVSRLPRWRCVPGRRVRAPGRRHHARRRRQDQHQNGITYSRFESAPDAPFTIFETVLPAGPHACSRQTSPKGRLQPLQDHLQDADRNHRPKTARSTRPPPSPSAAARGALNDHQAHESTRARKSARRAARDTSTHTANAKRANTRPAKRTPPGRRTRAPRGRPQETVGAANDRFRRALCEHMFVRWRTSRSMARSSGGCRATATPPPYAASRRPRRSTCASTRCTPSRCSTACPSIADAVPLDDQPVQGLQHACNYCFARPTHKYLDFNAGRDFEREIVVKVNAPEVLRGRARAAVVEARARRAGDEHRPLSVGRGPLPADGGHLGGTARLGQPVLGADEVAAAAARSPLMLEIAERHELQRVPVDPDARREGVAGDRAAHARTRARASRRSPSSTARASRRAC